MKLTLLGTGTPSPSLARQSSGYLLQAGSANIVIDHGGGAHQRLLETGIRAFDITHVFISHLHSDHILDLPRLVLQRWDQGADRIAPLKVFGPPPIADIFRKLFAEDGVFGPDIAARRLHPAGIAMYEARGGTPPRKPPEYSVMELSAGDGFEEAGLTFLAGPAQHLEPYLQCLGFRFASAEGVFVYTGDTGYSEKVIDFAAGCDVLLAMCQYLHESPIPDLARRTAASHLEVAQMAQKAGAATLVLTHLSEQFDDLRVRARAHNEMARIYGGEIIWGYDGAEIDISKQRRPRRFD